MPRSPYQLHAGLNAICARNQAKKQLRIKELARAGREIMSFPVPLTPGQLAAMDNMVQCFVAQQRLFFRYTDDGVDKLIEMFEMFDSLPIPSTQICPPDEGSSGLERATGSFIP